MSDLPPPTPPPPPMPAPNTTGIAIAWIGVVAAAVGSLLPWYSLGMMTLNGTDGDGVLTLVGAILAAGLLWAANHERDYRLAIAAAVVVALVALIYGWHLMTPPDAELAHISRGAGLWVGGLGSLAAFCAVGSLVSELRRQR